MGATRWLNDEEQVAWRMYLDGVRLLTAALDHQLQADAGLSLADYEILVRLSEAPERRLRMSDLADLTLFSRSRLSHAVSRLETCGWVTRASCPTDRRGTFATLTDEGFDKLVTAAPGHVEAVRTHLLDPLTAEQVRQLAAIGSAMRAAFMSCSPGDHVGETHAP